MEDKSTFLDELNAPQRAAVECLKGPMMIIAGAGSGKTRVITYRIAHLISQGVNPFSILALTFTNKAAAEMKERIGKIVGGSDAKAIWMGTFHSIFARILRAEAEKLGYNSNFTIYDADDSERLIKQIIKDFALDKDVYKAKNILSRISSLKNNLITVSAYTKYPEFQEADAANMRPKTIDIYREYTDRCFKANAMDFDDLLLKTNELLARFPDVLAKYQQRFRYILVDEYQDTNHSQYIIVRALADRYQNICVVGDDAQSIYSFRGANIANILNFQKDYPEAKVFKLEQNYRSSANIVGAAHSLIKKNKEQLEKHIFTQNPEGQPIKVTRLLTEADEGFYIAKTIARLKEDENLNNKDFAVLYRTNAQSRAIEDALRKKGIGYRIWGGMSFYQRKEIKDVLAYLRLAINPKDDQALLRIINFPARGIGDTTINRLTVAAAQYKRSLYEVMKNARKIPDIGINNATITKLEEFATLIDAAAAKAQSEDAFEVADFVLKNSGVIRVMSSATDPEEIQRYENVQELVNSIKDFCDSQAELVDGDPSLTGFVQDISLATGMDYDQHDKDNLDKVTLMTVHMAKGLEFPVVFVAGMEENLFPSMMSINTRQEIEEERRLFYVAITRAQKRVFLSYAEQRYRWGKLADGEISRFIEEIDEKYLDFDLPVTMRSAGFHLDASIFGPEKQNPIFGRSTTAPSSQFISKPVPRTPRNLKPISSISAKTGTTPTIGSFSVGDRVEHTRFGTGRVTEMEGSGADTKVSVLFDDGTSRKLILKFARLNKI